MDNLDYGQSISGELIKRISKDFITDVLYCIIERKDDDVEQELKKVEKIFYAVNAENRNEIEDTFFEKGFLCGEYFAVYKLYEELISNDQFDRNMNKMMKRAHVKEIVWYLLNHPESRHVEIARDIHVDTSQLSRIMKKLCNAGIVNKYQDSKFSYYVLSFAGKRYLKRNSSGFELQ